MSADLVYSTVSAFLLSWSCLIYYERPLIAGIKNHQAYCAYEIPVSPAVVFMPYPITRSSFVLGRLNHLISLILHTLNCIFSSNLLPKDHYFFSFKRDDLQQLKFIWKHNLIQFSSVSCCLANTKYLDFISSVNLEWIQTKLKSQMTWNCHRTNIWTTFTESEM